MDMRGQQHIPADRETVWNALNDPEILRVCIPGCQELTKSSDTEMTAVAVIKVGPVGARFQGAVTLSDLDPPNGYRISGEGQGGVAGFARGTAIVRLEPVDDGTLLHYEVEAQIGGKLSQLGGRLIDATARKLSGLFFEKFGQEILARQQPQPTFTSADAALGQDAGSRADATAHGGTSPDATHLPRPAASRTPPLPAPATGAASGVLSFLRLAAAAALGGAIVVLWLRYGGLQPAGVADGRAQLSPEFASAVQLIMAAAIGYLFGTRR